MGLLKPIAINRGRPREALKQALDEGRTDWTKVFLFYFFLKAPEWKQVKLINIQEVVLSLPLGLMYQFSR